MNRKKIVMLGPVYPYKGGIAHYTSLMYRQMAKRNNVTMFSYRLQYPKCLYPGGEQKDYKDNAFKIENTKFVLNTINPLSYLKTAREIMMRRPDLLIVQWWHPFFAPAYWSIVKLLRKRVPVLFICHNVLPHERFPFGRFLTRMTLKNGDGYIVQSKEDEQKLCSILLSPIYQKTVHPTYNIFKQKNLSREEARKQLAVEDERPILLFFGFVRKYKGLKYILEAMPAIHKKIPECELFVVGDFFEDDKEEYISLIEKTGAGSAVRIYDGYIPDNEVETFFAAADLVVLPYESATQSGIVQIAYGFGLPVLVTDVGGLPDVVSDGKTGYVVPPMDSEILGKKVIEFFEEDKKSEFQKNIQNETDRFSWDNMETVIEKVYEEVKQKRIKKGR